MASLPRFALIAVAGAATVLAAATASAQICGRRDGCGNSSNDFRVQQNEERGAPEQVSPERQRADASTQSGLAESRVGNHAIALGYFREALAAFPRNRTFRYNVAITLQHIAGPAFDAALAAGDYGGLDAIVHMLDEADGLGGGDRAWGRRARHAISQVRREAAETARQQESERRRLEAMREAEEQRQRGAGTRIASLVADTARIERTRPENMNRVGALAFGEPNISESNPVTRSGRDGDIRQGEARAGSPARARTIERLDNLGRGRESLGQGFDGGGDSARATATIDNLPRLEGISAERQERLNLDPRFRVASASLQRAREAARQAQANQAALEAQRDAAPDDDAKLRIQIAIANASAEALRTLGVERQAEQRQQAVIQLIEVQGAPIIRNRTQPPPPPVPNGSGPPPPAAVQR